MAPASGGTTCTGYYNEADCAHCSPKPERQVDNRPALNGVPIKHVELTPTGVLMRLADGTRAYSTRSV